MAILIDQMVPFSNIDPDTSTSLWCKLIFQPLMAGFLSVGGVVYPMSRNILVIQPNCNLNSYQLMLFCIQGFYMFNPSIIGL